MSQLGVVRWLEVGFNSTNGSSLSPFSPETKDEWLQAHVPVSVCVITLLLIHTHLSCLTKMGMSSMLAFVSLVISLLLAPVVGALLLVFMLYRYIVSIILKVTVGPRYNGLLHGPDAFWGIEEDASLSIINVLALADFSFIVSASNQGEEPLQTITDLIQERLLAPGSPFPKLVCLRQLSRLGYFYWRKQDVMNVADHIRWMDIEDQGDKTITEISLKNFIPSLANTPLQANHKAGWEILVGRYPIKPSSDLLGATENGGWITKSCAGTRYPVLFRIHHSIGDGVALVKLFLDSLADPSSRSSTPSPYLESFSPSFNKNFVRSKTLITKVEQEQSQFVTLWQKPDDTKCTQSNYYDVHLKSISHNSLSDISSLQQKNKSYNFSDCKNVLAKKNYNIPESKSNIKVAYNHFTRGINENTDFKVKINENKFKEFDIVINNRPSEEFLDLINDATELESQFENGTIQNFDYQYFLRKYSALIFPSFNFACRIIASLKSLAHQWSILFFAPATILNQTLIQAENVNLLHGPRLSGHKVVAWYLEQQIDSDQLLMSMIKRIRVKTGVRFSDVLLTAVSTSLEKFYNQFKEVPECITVVIPVRLGGPPKITSNPYSKRGITENFEDKLENKFTVGLFALPILNQSSGKLKLLSKLMQVQHHVEQLRSSPDFQVNYWMLRVLGTLLPVPLLQPLVSSSHCTLVLSNLPGPDRLTHLAGHTLHDLVFWVPNRTSTGVGVTVLSYAGRLQLGLIADCALIPDQQDAQLILNGIISAIQDLEKILC